MQAMFAYPQFDSKGNKALTTTDGPFQNMLMDITVCRMQPGETRSFALADKEMAILLIQGSLAFSYAGEQKQARRENFFTQGAWCLHVPAATPVEITAHEESEVLVQQTVNPRAFAPVFYTPSDGREETFGKGLYDDKAVRTVRTLFDYDSAPYSNLVLGEILNAHGSWSSYIPHEHPQPEVYYYRFEKPQGFGACFIGDNVYKIKDGSFAAIPGGNTHPQVAAPGYPMYYVWMIRHFDGQPWTDRIEDPDHTWLLHASF